MENCRTQPRQNSEVNPNSTFRLSAELVIVILQCLHPNDIMSMRKTCRMNFQASKARVVWLTALDRICETHGIFKPTFPKRRMSLLELEHAALSPRRFVKCIKQHQSNDPALPYQNRVLPLRKRTDPRFTYPVNSLFLVPGGRFLFTSHPASGIALWDLGYNANIPIRPFPIATLDQPQVELQNIAPSADGKEILLAVKIRSDDGSTLKIYRIDPRIPSDGFRLEGQLSQLSSFRAFICSNVVHVCFRPYFIAWNWAENTGCKWDYRCPGRRFYSSIDTILVDSPSVIAYQGGEVDIWDTPTLTCVTQPSVEGFPLVNNPPKHSLKPTPGSFNSFNDSDYVFSGTSMWQRQQTASLHLLSLYEKDDSDLYHLALYTLQRLEVRDPSIPWLLPALNGLSENVHGNHPAQFKGDGVSALFHCDDHLVFCAASETGPNISDRQIVAVALPLLSPSLNNTIDRYSMTLTPGTQDIELHSDDQIGFCPMSGRLVYMLNDGKELRLTDYLLPPEEPEHLNY